MPGLAKTNKFLLSTATVMLGPVANLMSLNPAAHSIGLSKNFALTLEPGYTELTQGIQNTIVMSVRTSEPLRTSFEVYEYTLRNIAYASGLDASGVAYDPTTTIALSSTSTAPAATTITVASDVSAQFPVGTYFFIQAGTDDIVHIAKVTAVAFATGVTTITFAGYATPAGVTFPAGARIGKVTRIDVGSGALFQPELAMKVVGVLPGDNAPFTMLFPKVKVTRGLNVNFDSANFTNMPFEVTPYSQVSTDPMYAEFGSAAAILFPR